VDALLWAIPAVLALAALTLAVLPRQDAVLMLRAFAGLWIAALVLVIPLLLSRS
jgi:hypothetical protein